MKLEYYPLKKLKKEIIKIVGKYLDFKKYRIFFFGSRVTGKASARSDIDIGIEGPEPVSLVVIAKIREELSDLPILYHIDIVDFKSADEDFRQVARQNLELITP